MNGFFTQLAAQQTHTTPAIIRPASHHTFLPHQLSVSRAPKSSVDTISSLACDSNTTTDSSTQRHIFPQRQLPASRAPDIFANTAAPLDCDRITAQSALHLATVLAKSDTRPTEHARQENTQTQNRLDVTNVAPIKTPTTTQVAAVTKHLAPRHTVSLEKNIVWQDHGSVADDLRAQTTPQRITPASSKSVKSMTLKKNTPLPQKTPRANPPVDTICVAIHIGRIKIQHKTAKTKTSCQREATHASTMTPVSLLEYLTQHSGSFT
jgi:hypothetical protein